MLTAAQKVRAPLSVKYPVSTFAHPLRGGGGGVAQSVERTTPGQEVPDSIPAVAARSLLVGSMLV